MQLELGQAGTEASPRPWVETAPNQGKRDWARTQHDPEDSAGIPPLVGLYSLPWVTGILHDHKRAKGIEITRLNLCNPLSLGEKYFSWALLLYIGLFLRDLNFSKCLASKESQGKNSVCLDDIKKRQRAGKQAMFCWMQSCKAGGVFYSLQIKSWPTYFAVKSDTRQQAFIKATFILRETEKVILQYSPRL